jgi:hypothetical protein
MPKVLLALFLGISCGISHSQSPNNLSPQSSQSGSSTADGSDPTLANSPFCAGSQQGPGQLSANAVTGRDYSSGLLRTPVLSTPGGPNADQYAASKPPLFGAKFHRLRFYPGDQIVVPYKLPIELLSTASVTGRRLRRSWQ